MFDFGGMWRQTNRRDKWGDESTEEEMTLIESEM